MSGAVRNSKGLLERGGNLDERKLLKTRYPEGYGALCELFGDERIRAKEDRLNQIYQMTEREWNRNIQRFHRTSSKVNYILIAEAAPWSSPGEDKYFYLNPRQPLKAPIWRAFFQDEKYPLSNEEYYIRLAKAGFVLIDSLPFAEMYSGRRDVTGQYLKLVRKSRKYLTEKLCQLPLGNDVKVALAWNINGRALIDAYNGSVTLPNGLTIPIDNGSIIANASNYPCANLLAQAFN